ncbi:carboxypeptidase-like regulatory domain-containing protein [Polaribacter sp.]|uniref:carboxypeptidase-like regulatory domain-containing protein n=1 Tax=Polaribacter sp. TaxID=1920175 RepID=UPI003F6A499F
MKKLIYVLIILTYTQPIFGQETKEYLIIEGKIFAEGSTLMYASIGIVNKNIGTITDDNGKFILEIPSIFSNESLTISHIGYQTKQISINDILNEEFIKIKLIPKGIRLNEVIVTANRKRIWKQEKTRYVFVAKRR